MTKALTPSSVIMANLPPHCPRHVMLFDAVAMEMVGAPLSTREAGKRWGISHVSASKIIEEAKSVKVSLGASGQSASQRGA